MPYASPGEAVATKLLATSGVTTLVGQKVYPSKPTLDVGLPYVVYYKTSGGDGVRSDGPNTLKQYGMRVDCYAQSEAQAEAIRAAVVAAFAGWQDKPNNVAGCFPAGDADESPVDDGSQQAGQSFSLWFYG